MWLANTERHWVADTDLPQYFVSTTQFTVSGVEIVHSANPPSCIKNNPCTSSKVSGRDVTRLVSVRRTIFELAFTQAAQLLHIDRETGFSNSACAVEHDLTTIFLLLLLGDLTAIIHTLLCYV